MNRCFPLFASFCLLASLVGCVTPGSGSRSDESLSQQVNRHDQQIQNLLSQVGQVEQVLPGQAEMWSQMQSMRQELNVVQGQLDTITQGGAGSSPLSARVDRLEAAVRQMASQMGITISALDAPLPVSQGDSPALTHPLAMQNTHVPSPQVITPPTSVAQQPVDASLVKRVYDSGIQAFNKREYQQAINTFKELTKTYPKHALASNAAFWEGESYYQLKEYGRAALAYQDVIDKYPGSSKMQASMLKQGMALHAAGKKAAAKERLQDLVKRYPKSMESDQATKFLEKNK